MLDSKSVLTWREGGDLLSEAVEYCRIPDKGRYVEREEEESWDKLVMDSLRRTLVGLTHSACKDFHVQSVSHI